MKKILIIPDSFKGTMSSSELCDIMGRVVSDYCPEAEVIKIPVSDGGEGTVDSFLKALGGSRISVAVNGPYMQETESFYGLTPDSTAVIEMAAAAGLPLVGEDKNPLGTTTYGVGELIRHAAQNGAKRIVVGLGGSATNDGGAGAAAACGVRFFKADGSEFIPVGGTLIEIDRIDMSGLSEAVSRAEIVTMCDIDNPLCGDSGAAAVFGPQKGASPKDIKALDSGLRHLAKIVKRDLKADILTLPGAAAAGGMGGGMSAFFGSNLEMGIETVLDTVGFDSLLSGADMVLSGEGRIDTQSLHGKVVMGVARRTKKAGVPLIAIVGDIGDNIESIYDEGVTSVISINRVAVPYSEAKLRSKSDLTLTLENIMRLLAIGKLGAM